MKLDKLTADQLAAVYWFIDHLSFDDYLRSVPPHLGARVDIAYEIRDALGALTEQLRKHGVRAGDWMYRVRTGEQS